MLISVLPVFPVLKNENGRDGQWTARGELKKIDLSLSILEKGKKRKRKGYATARSQDQHPVELLFR